MPVEPPADDGLALRLNAMGRRLNSCCKGLLEVERGLANHNRPYLTVQYFHWTVRDFAKSRSSSRTL